MFVHVRPNEPISSTQARSSNFKASNIRPSKTISASNVCSGKPVCTNYVRPSRFLCEKKFCQRKPTSDSNILHKPICSNHICFVIHQYQLNRYHLYFYFPFYHII